MMNALHATVRTERIRIVVTLLIALLSLSALASPVAAQEESSAPAATPTAAESACASAEDLAFIISFIGNSIESESGLVPLGIGVVAAVGETRTLASLVGETYRPLVEDLLISLENLRETMGALEDLDTAGAKLASTGEAVADIGNAMDELTVQLRTRCSDD